jgi:hypothetical protein
VTGGNTEGIQPKRIGIGCQDASSDCTPSNVLTFIRFQFRAWHTALVAAKFIDDEAQGPITFRLIASVATPFLSGERMWHRSLAHAHGSKKSTRSI